MKMILFLCALSFLLHANPSPAADVPKDFHLYCTTQSAYARISVAEEKVRFQMESAHGFLDFPISSGTVTPAMLPLVQRAMKDLAVFDGKVVLEWERSKCSVHATHAWLMKCDGRGRIVSPANTDLTLTSLGTSVDSLRSMDIDAEIMNMHFGISTPETDFVHHFINMPFDQKRCTRK